LSIRRLGGARSRDKPGASAEPGSILGSKPSAHLGQQDWMARSIGDKRG
jgi:hypothetical protein